MPVTDEALPEFFRRSDAYSNDWQQRFLRVERLQLVALILVAGVASIGATPAVTIICFAVALMTQVFRLITKADQRWWNGRAGAESAKRASWLYMIGGRPFELGNPTAEVEFAARLTTIAESVADLAAVPTVESHVTDAMRALRHSALAERVEIYRVERIVDQRKWYAKKSKFNAERADRWSLAGIASTGLALGLGIVCAIQNWSFDAVGFFAALAASIAAWLALKQHQVLARAYAVASNELASIEAKITSTSWDEDLWAAFVNEAEEAISREHASWRAARAV
jgi:hypothetical protein